MWNSLSLYTFQDVGPLIGKPLNYEKVYDTCIVKYCLHTFIMPWIINDDFTG